MNKEEVEGSTELGHQHVQTKTDHWTILEYTIPRSETKECKTFAVCDFTAHVCKPR